MLSYLPSAVALVGLVKLAAFVTLAYYLSLRQFPSLRGIAAFVLFMIALLGFYEGFALAAREESRLRYGRVVSGVVVEMYRPNGRGGTVTPTGRQGPTTGASTYLIAGALARRIAYGCFQSLMVDYRYPCRAGRGTCFERDLVSSNLWSRLAVGQPGEREAECR